MNRPDALTPEQSLAREAVRGLSRPAADPAFRARLRSEFAGGTIAADPASRGTPVLRVVPFTARPAIRWGGAALAAAAAFVVVTLLNQAPDWRMGAVSGDGIVVVDGVPVPVAHAADLERRLRQGARVQVPAGVQIELVSAGQLAVQFSPNTEASVPGLPGRWFRRAGTAELRSGELRVTTGSGFRGATFAITTPEARVQVTGTTFALICEPAGTCLCVMEGRVRIGARGGPGEAAPGSAGYPGAMHEVVEGRRRYVFADGREDESAEMRHTEHGPLGEFRERMKVKMGAR